MNNLGEIKITIPQEVAGKTLHFNSIEELQNWINGEQSAYGEFVVTGKHFSPRLQNHVNTQFAQIHNLISAMNQTLARRLPIDGYSDQILSWFKVTYSSKKLILSTSAEFRMALSLKEKSPIKAAIFLGHLLSINNLYQQGFEDINMLEGAFEYFQYKDGYNKDNILAEREALQDLKNEWDKHLTEYKGQEDNLKTQFEATKTNFDQYFVDTKHQLDEYLTKHTNDLEELKNTYDQLMSLKAPVEYWQKKKTKHKDNIIIFSLINTILAAVGGFIFIHFVSKNFNDIGISYWKISVFIFLVTLFFWALRVLMKIMLSHIHLQGDAHEREVMCQTYLALLRNNSGLEENDKKLILSTLFRPSTSGIMGEDGIPPGIYDMMTKIVSSK